MYLFLFYFISMTSLSQTKSLIFELNDSIEYHIKFRNKLKAKYFIEKLNSLNIENPDLKYFLHKNQYYYHFILKQNDSCKYYIDKVNLYFRQLNLNNQNDYYLNKAYFLKSNNSLDSSALYFTKALKFYEVEPFKYSNKTATIYLGLSSIYRLTNNKDKQFKYLTKYLEEAKSLRNGSKISSAYNNIGVYYDENNEPLKAIDNFKKSLNYKQRSQSRNSTLQNIGSIYLNHFNNIDSAYFYNKKAINKYTSERSLAYLHYDLSIIAKRKKELFLENKELQTALRNIKLDPFEELEVKLYKELSENNKNLKNYKKSLFFLEKYDSLNKILKNQYLIEKVEDIETKYQTEKKEKENLKLKAQNIEAEAERQKNKIFLTVSLLFILLGGTIGLLSLKNSKRKRKLAEQDKELETQKNLTLLKEQELTTINAMVDGQEKERKRIAEDLHDNLGSVLATLKLHFENLKMNREKKKINQETLFDKTENLIDEAYLKVRRIAHAKNAGVIANQGLLTAIQMMAEKISSADKVKIEVVDFGLDKRLENSLEITIFRIIQELLTNIMKHAEAKNATINISLYDKNLNIIIEDDGKGFDLKKVNLKNGMGISSIKTRVEHLKGTFEVDATIGKGSSIIIDIPID